MNASVALPPLDPSQLPPLDLSQLDPSQLPPFFDPSQLPLDAIPKLLFSETQNRVLTTVRPITGGLSLCGSLLVIYIIAHGRRKLLKNSYDRLILGLSSCDVVASLGFMVFGPWSIPENAFFIRGARAPNNLTCDIGGCLLHLLIANSLYTAGLMMYFLLLVKFEWPASRIATRVEPWIHASIWTTTLSTMIVAVVKEYMNPIPQLPGVCWITSLPANCEFKPAVPCWRGEGAQRFARGIASLPMLTIVIVVVVMVTLVIKVRATEQRLAQYHVSGSSITSMARTRRTAQRGLAYIAAFLFTSVPPAVFIFIFARHPPQNETLRFVMALTVAVCSPSQGIWNAMIYIRPKWRELTRPPHGSLVWLGRLLPCGRSSTGTGTTTIVTTNSTTHVAIPSANHVPTTFSILTTRGNCQVTHNSTMVASSSSLAINMSNQNEEKGEDIGDKGQEQSAEHHQDHHQVGETMELMEPAAKEGPQNNGMSRIHDTSVTTNTTDTEVVEEEEQEEGVSNQEKALPKA